ncbi:MAG: NAD(P) transhydrogenase subunit alpha [Chloroflexi bacterium]|jgi:NAD(P) transhydrogenase subunit alpha|nr:MAG: NAD(P) transhydrogenase subunit alpha [Chloroflexota bacterium]
MKVGIPKESLQGEKRVALVPNVVPMLSRLGLDVVVESGAGESAGYSDAEFQGVQAQILKTTAEVYSASDIVLKVRASEVGETEISLMKQNHTVIGLFDPLGSPQVANLISKTGATSFALELVPRISRAQSMDALTSQATITGYKSVLMAADKLPKMFPMLMTAAGTITPAKVFVIGAGVAGLQAIATANRLGAVVSGYDVRPAVKDQVESLGATFIEIELEIVDSEEAGGYAQAMGEEFYDLQRKLLTAVVSESDVVITTAAIPGKPAPVLITTEMVKQMKSGSIIVDLAAETGGNCELTKAGEEVEEFNVSVIGPVNLASSIPYHASQMYARNQLAFLRNMVKESSLNIDMSDQIIQESLLTKDGKVVNGRVAELLAS